MLRVRFVGFLAAVSLFAAYAVAIEGNRPSTLPAAPTKSTADDLVRSALEAEAKADMAKRRELLAEAIEADQGNAAARWQLGQVFYKGSWLSIEDVARQAGGDKLLIDYIQMRGKFGDSPEAQRALARWCQKAGLADAARAHATRLHEMLPDDAEALKILGLSWNQGLLLTPEQIALRKAHDEKSKEALRYWQPRILEIRKQIDSKDEAVSAAGWKALRAVQDPSAIGALEAVFTKHRHDESLEVVKVVGRMNSPAATDSLVRHALLSKWEDVRLAACEQLHQQSPIGYVPKLIAALTRPTETRIEVVRDQDEVRIREITERQDTTTRQQQVTETRVPLFVPNPNLASIVNVAAIEASEHAKAAAGSTKAAKRVERHRQEMNEEIYTVLEKSTGQTLPRDPDSWYVWWRQQNYMPINDKQIKTHTYPQYVDVPYVPYVPPNIPIYSAPPIATAERQLVSRGCDGCFALGTKVWTMTGPVAIEKLQVGDQVLAQNPLSGELTYKPVLRTTVGHQELESIDLGDERIEATLGHVFWVSGKGWRMAADLKVGDRLHTLHGWSEIVDLKQIAGADTRNLVVADYGTYFVGEHRLLVHDVTMIDPYCGKVPGDMPGHELAAK